MGRVALRTGRGGKRGGRRGQILLALAVAVSALVMSIAILSYATSVLYGKFQHVPFMEVSSAIASDFGRALTRTLSVLTQTYNATSDINAARAKANDMLTTWLLAATSAFAGKGVNIQPTWTSSQVQPLKTLYGYNYSARSVYNLSKLYWYQPQSLSAVGASISVDLPTAGFFGFRQSFLFLLNLTIDVPSILIDAQGGTVSFRIQVLREGQQPVFDLTSANFEVRCFDPTASSSLATWRTALIAGIEYEGLGNYVLTVEPQFRDPSNASSFWDSYYRYLDIIAVDNRDVLVEACSYSGIGMEIHDNSDVGSVPGDPRPGYVLEVLSNSTTLWFGTQLQQPTSPPLPPIPGKQFSVLVQFYSGGEQLGSTVSAQVETWEPSQRFPSSDGIGIPSRFLGQSRLVFPVKFPQDVDALEVMISWEPDCDMGGASGTLTRVEGEPVISIDNGYYIADVLNTSEPSCFQNFTVSLQRSGSTVRYWLSGYDTADVNGATLLPREVPFGSWTALGGPVRWLVFRRSSSILDRLYSNVTTAEAVHETTIFFPLNESYFYWQMNLTWKGPIMLSNKFIRMFAMEANTGVNLGSLSRSDGVSLVNGSFSAVPMEHRDRRYNLGQDYGHWASVYSQDIGAAIIVPDSTLSELHSLNGDQLWVWTSASLQRLMEYDLLYFMSPSVGYTTNPTDPLLARGVGLLYEGGTASEPYQNDMEWRVFPQASVMRSSTGVDVPRAYSRLFLEGSAPTIVSVLSF